MSGRPAAAAGGAAGDGDGVAVPVAGETSVPTGDAVRGSAKPQSSSRPACREMLSGFCSPYIIVTISRRFPCLAAPMNEWCAASVKPFLPPNAPG